MDRIRHFAACSTPSAIAPGRSKSPYYSELNDFFGFFRLAIAVEMDFFEGISTNLAACIA